MFVFKLMLILFSRVHVTNRRYSQDKEHLQKIKFHEVVIPVVFNIIWCVIV